MPGEVVDFTQLALVGVSILILIYAFLKLNEKVDSIGKTNNELNKKVDAILDKLHKQFPDSSAD